MSAIQIENLTFSYPDSVEPVIDGLTLHFDSDWKLGLIGKNGKGKSTFLKLLCGELSGKGRICAKLTFSRFPHEIKNEDKTAYEVAEELSPQTQFWKILREVNLIGLSEETLFQPFSTLSGGERTKLQLAVLFAEEGYPLIDEPTDHLDLEGRRALANYLAGKRGYLVVSHDRAFLDGCCDHILAFGQCGAEIVRGNYSVWREERDKRERGDSARREKLEKERVRLGKAAARAEAWANSAESEKYHNDERASVDRGFLGAKAAKLQKRSATIAARREKAETEIKDLLKSFEEKEELRLLCEPFFREELIRLIDVGVDFPAKKLLKTLNFSMKQKERVAIVGRNGCGKSTLLKLIVGELTEFSGKRAISSRLKISYVPQTAKLRGTLKEYAEQTGIDESDYKALLTKFGFARKDFSRQMSAFSEGQKKKAVLARSLCERANLYVWDEPLNYLDVDAREQLEKAILASDASIVFVEHDANFLKTVATRVLCLT